MTVSILPNNSTQLEQGLEAVFSRELPVNIGDIWQPDRCPEHLLGALAWGLSIDVWDDNWPIDVKRKVCQNAILVHQHKGTVYAIRTALDSLNASIDLVEWFETDGAPFTAQLIAYAATNLDASGDTLLTPSLQNKMWAVVKSAKNARTHIDFKVGVSVKNALHTTAFSSGLSVQRNNIKALSSAPAKTQLWVAHIGLKSIEINRLRVTIR